MRVVPFESSSFSEYSNACFTSLAHFYSPLKCALVRAAHDLLLFGSFGGLSISTTIEDGCTGRVVRIQTVAQNAFRGETTTFHDKFKIGQLA